MCVLSEDFPAAGGVGSRGWDPNRTGSSAAFGEAPAAIGAHLNSSQCRNLASALPHPQQLDYPNSR